MKKRLDQLLVDKGLFQSRERAKTTIMAGKILVNEVKVEKPGTSVKEDVSIRVLGEVHPFVSRGGLKLQKGLQEFNLSLQNKTMIDIGASTGGFTDCALQNGAAKVYAIDVGYGQLDWKLRQDSRVIVWERTNIRHVQKQDFSDPIDFVSIDVSFISLGLVLPIVKNIIEPHSELICLLKPQFEAGKERVGKKGVVSDSKMHVTIIEEVLAKVEENGFFVHQITHSPITGPEGNIEFLIQLSLNSNLQGRFFEVIEIVNRAHLELGQRGGK